MIEQQKNEVWLTPNKWSYEERRLHIFNGTRFFEKNYSKWATVEVDKFEDIEVIGKDGEDYIVEFNNDTHFISADDTYYEYWWGDKSLKKKFEKNNEYYMEEFLERQGYDGMPKDVKITAVIPKEDYVKLKQLYKRSDER